MKVIISIGHTDILLPSAAGVEALLKMLGKGFQVSERLYKGEVVLGAPLKIEMKTVPAGTRFLATDSDGREHDLAPTVYVKKQPARLNGQRTLRLGDGR